MESGETNPWYAISNLDKADTPALVVYPDRVKENISRLIRLAGGNKDRLRPHVKTHKSREGTLLLMEAGITKFKCATIAEADMLGHAGAADVLLAYQPVGPKIDRLIWLINNYPATVFSCLVDDQEAALDISARASAAGLQIPVYIDLNVGMNRTGIGPKKAEDLYAFAWDLPGIRPKGLHVYDGHITGKDFQVRKKSCDEAFGPVARLRDRLKNGFPEPLIVAGGSATFAIHAGRPGVECSPGTFIYWDEGYLQMLPELPFLPAALVISRVVSLPGGNLICTDLGHKSVASEQPPDRRVLFLNAPDLKPAGQSEEHLVLSVPEGQTFQIGDVLYGLPYHICPTCALYERALVVQHGTVVGEWKIIARDRKIFI